VSGVFRQRSCVGQGKGPDVELMVSGTPLYASYETLDGFPVIYDDDRELFCYARLRDDGAFESTGVSVDSAPPPEVIPHAQESEIVRAEKIEARSRQMEVRARNGVKGRP
jgi:hypothetical protein